MERGEPMWFDELDPEAIRERLFNEGHFTKPLENLSLNEQNDEAAQKMTMIEADIAVLEIVATDILLPWLSGMLRFSSQCPVNT
jgi:hypothetical protein